MSDRLAVMRGGRARAAREPREVYERPATAFVADFIGSANLFELELEVGSVTGGLAECPTSGGVRVRVRPRRCIAGQSLSLLVRPERVAITANADDPDIGTRVRGRVTDTAYLGGVIGVTATVPGLGALECTTRPAPWRAAGGG